MAIAQAATTRPSIATTQAEPQVKAALAIESLAKCNNYSWSTRVDGITSPLPDARGIIVPIELRDFKRLEGRMQRKDFIAISFDDDNSCAILKDGKIAIESKNHWMSETTAFNSVDQMGIPDLRSTAEAARYCKGPAENLRTLIPALQNQHEAGGIYQATLTGTAAADAIVAFDFEGRPTQIKDASATVELGVDNGQVSRLVLHVAGKTAYREFVDVVNIQIENVGTTRIDIPTPANAIIGEKLKGRN